MIEIHILVRDVETDGAGKILVAADASLPATADVRAALKQLCETASTALPGKSAEKPPTFRDAVLSGLAPPPQGHEVLRHPVRPESAVRR